MFQVSSQILERTVQNVSRKNCLEYFQKELSRIFLEYASDRQSTLICPLCRQLCLLGEGILKKNRRLIKLSPSVQVPKIIMIDTIHTPIMLYLCIHTYVHIFTRSPSNSQVSWVKTISKINWSFLHLIAQMPTNDGSLGPSPRQNSLLIN